MTNIIYEVGLYKDKKWAVFCYGPNVWYFPTENTKEAAERYAKHLNKSV